ncbi:MAG: dihydroorotate dehydrogenase electron transfer subunit [Candidatus Cloacimonetes bacterium]|nr:dihydroorotate dehydrogenase electron transfer subunit [Candidatus Cloacimonadota bacterium]
MSRRNTIAIARIVEETPTIRTFYFDYDLQAKPGQFIMLTDLANGEKPFSISECESDQFGVTIKKLGKFTSNLFEKQAGDLLSFRGAYGSSFSLKGNNILLTGGGYATPPLYYLCKELLRKGAQVTVVNGARTRDDLVFCERFENLGLEYKKITDAGCFGRAGTSVDIARELLSNNDYDMVYVSGPELMMKAMRELLQSYPGLNYEFLFERYMKCAIGICGNCTMDPLGIRLCVEGPVLAGHQVEKLTEFGEYHRNAAGKKEYFK